MTNRILHTGILVAMLACDALAQSLPPGFTLPPGMTMPNRDNSRGRSGRRQGNDPGQAAPGVPVPLDSPLFDAFRKLEQQSVYHQRMKITASDPRMADMMAQLGFTPAETVTAGDTKQVSMHLMMPIAGKTEDMELRSVLRNGKLAKKWISPGSGRYLKEVDASVAKQLADAEAQYASSIAKNLASGPMGWATAGMDSALAAAAPAMAMKARKTAHDFFEWTCMDSAAAAAPNHSQPPPLTDLKLLGDQTLDGVAVTTYEFYVTQNGRSQGPMQLHVAKDSGLPMRIGMNDPRMQGSMEIDYFGFNEGADFERPGCLDK